MAKKKVRPPKKTPSVKKASAKKAQPKKKVKQLPAPKKSPPAKKPSVRKSPAKKTRTVPANKVNGARKKTQAQKGLDPAGRLRKELALSRSQLSSYWEQYVGSQLWVGNEAAIPLVIDGYVELLQKAGRDKDIEEALALVESVKSEEASKPASHPELRQRVAELLNKLDDRALQWLHFEMTDPDAESKIETDEQAEEAMANFPPLDRPALVQTLTSIAVDDFQLADNPDQAKRLVDEFSIWMFLTSNKS